MSKVLVTGASGFLGRYVCPALAERGHAAAAAVRTEPESEIPDAGSILCIGDIGPDTDWGMALEGVDAVVHLAARVHVMRETRVNPGAEYRRVNVEGTTRLARQAVEAGTKRFVFVSTVKVNGERTAAAPFSEATPPTPEDAYGISKWAAERALTEVGEETGLEVVILRPPLIYGAGAGGNFLSLLKVLDRAVPLPLAAIDNRRSLIFAGNVADAIALSLEAKAAPGNTYLLSDGADVSTPELVRRVARALGRPARLFWLPVAGLRFAAAIVGKQGVIDRLASSLQVDDRKIRRELGWNPPYSMIQGLEETAAWYKNRGNA